MGKSCLYFIIVTFFAFSGCDQDKINPKLEYSCKDLAAAILDNDSEKVKVAVDQVLQNYTPFERSKTDDRERFDALIFRFEACPEIEVIDNCFGCLYSNPPQSTINVKVSWNGHTTAKWIRLRHDFETNLFFAELY